MSDNALTWKSYHRDRLIAKHESGFVMIKPANAQQPVDMFCSLCDHAMRSKEDEREWHLYGCCNRCAQMWAHARKDQWRSGWRPTKKQIEDAEVERMPLRATLVIE